MRVFKFEVLVAIDEENVPEEDPSGLHRYDGNPEVIEKAVARALSKNKGTLWAKVQPVNQ